MDSLQVGNSRTLHDTTTSFGQPYNIVTNPQVSFMSIGRRRHSLYKRGAGA
jgi:hypothetical protein